MMTALYLLKPDMASIKTSTIMAYRIVANAAALCWTWTVAWTVLHGRVNRLCNAGTQLPNAFLEVTQEI